MRRSLSAVFIVLAFALLAGVAGCDYGTSPSGTPATTRVSLNDTRALTKAILDATGQLDSLTCSFDVHVNVNLDPDAVSSGNSGPLGMFQGPIKVSGTISYDGRTEAGQIDVAFATSGITYSMGVRTIGDKTWLLMLGQWYDFSPVMADAGRSEEIDMQGLQDKMTGLGVDPLDWLGSVQLVGQESVGTTEVNHLTCAPDMYVLFGDVLTLMQDQEFMDYVDPSRELADPTSQSLPTTADIRDMRDQLSELLSDFTMDLRAGNTDNILRQANLSMHLEPPAGEPNDGVQSIDVAAELMLEDMNKPLEIKAPEKFLPYSSLQNLFGSDSPLPFFNDPVDDEPSKS
jgi:hypothetical protein